MIVHDVEQGTPEWHQVRCGIPTASEFDKILTPTGKSSTQAEAYANRIIAEIMTGGAVETWQGNMWSERGNELEAEAASYYEIRKAVKVQKVGFITDDARTMGASPDRLVGNDGLLEIKCPAPHTHVEYLLKQKIDQGYFTQLQGQLLVTGRAWVDIVSYYPTMPSIIMRVERDAIYLSKLRGAIAEFNATVAEKRERMKELGYLE